MTHSPATSGLCAYTIAQVPACAKLMLAYVYMMVMCIFVHMAGLKLVV